MEIELFGWGLHFSYLRDLLLAFKPIKGLIRGRYRPPQESGGGNGDPG